MLSSILQNFSSSLTTVHSLLSPPSAHSDRLTLSDLNDDVLLHICGFLIYATQDFGSRQHNRYLKPLSLVNRRLHEITSVKLFKSFIVSAKDDRNDGDWETGRRFILDLLHYDPILLRNIKTLKFNIYTAGPPKRDAPTDDIHLFVTLLSKLTHLHHLELFFPPSHAPILIHTLSSSPTPLLSTLETLITNPSTAPISTHSPNLTRLRLTLRPLSTYRDLSPTLPLLPSALPSALPSLLHLEALCAWTPSDIAALLQTCPSLLSLALLSPVPYADRPPDIFERLGRHMKHLRRLDVSEHERVDLHAYRYAAGSRAGAERERVQRGRREAQARVAEEAFGRMGGLEVLWIGESVVVSRGEGDGEEELEWVRGGELRRSGYGDM